MQFIVALLKKLPILPIVLFIVGLALGLLIGWVLAPVEFVDATPPTCVRICRRITCA
jgi:hypothetical protein